MDDFGYFLMGEEWEFIGYFFLLLALRSVGGFGKGIWGFFRAWEEI
jgi:hypothetical protein